MTFSNLAIALQRSMPPSPNQKKSRKTYCLTIAMPAKLEYNASKGTSLKRKKPAGGRLKVKINLLCVGITGGLSVGFLLFLMDAPWWSLGVCAIVGLLIGSVLAIGYSGANARLLALIKLLRALPLWDRIAMSIVLVISATAVYIGIRDLPISGAYGLFLGAIVLAQVLFGTKSGLAAALASQVAVHYFTIPPKNSFAVHSMHDIGILAVFALMALVTWITIALLSDIARGKTRRFSRN
jgi:hypothetical protein